MDLAESIRFAFSSPFVWLGVGAIFIIYFEERLRAAKKKQKKALEHEKRIAELERELRAKDS